MKNSKLQEMTVKQLENHIDKLRIEISEKRRQLRLNELPNVREVKTLRRELARTLTLITSTKLKEAKSV